MFPSPTKYFSLLSRIADQMEARSRGRFPISFGSSNGTGSNMSTGRIIRSNSSFCLELSIRFSVARTPKTITVMSPITASRTNTPPIGIAAEYFLLRAFLDIVSRLDCFFCSGETSGTAFSCCLFSFSSAADCVSFWFSFSASGSGSLEVSAAAGCVCSNFCHPVFSVFVFFTDITQPHFIRFLLVLLWATAQPEVW